MRILLSCLQSPHRHPIPAYKFWEDYFKKGIEEAGHEWIEVKDVDWAEGLVYSDTKRLQEWRNFTWETTIKYIKKQQEIKAIDLFLSYLFPQQINSDAIKHIQSLGIPCVNFFCDNVREFTQIPNEFCCFDLHWVPEFKALKMYQQANLKYLYAPMPVWIPYHQRSYKHSENYGVSFIGSRDVQREALLAQVLSFVPVEIRGSGWDNTPSSSSISSVPQHQSFWQTGLNQWKFISHQGTLAWLRKLKSKSIPRIANDTFTNFVKQPPNADEYTAIIQQSIITLGINRYPSYRYPFYKPDTYSRMRDIEAPMMGACYLTEWTEGLEHLYELGEEIETYRNVDDMVEKIQYLIKSPDVRQKLRYNGQKRALSEHTVPHSISKICRAIT
ncbi:hypothetical protein ACX27_18220 [Nostoc piscinale CENA21]|uniref:Spore protein YkvP/CgeB glycosyl transferase-like domain-containing protein n=1 Tax=Nostoc piscinale CENA21 TaxID=224013 RepID=A0A0M4TXV7_9NOSO|nr:glycosyltransferase [Nostoc piscinale]ALF54339.1 hypothetical protein ACX27_18220 [Nostoc piscinale CENA21]